MYFVLGLLTAGLLALTVAPAVWRRAARLTRARVEGSVPLSLAEIAADKDQLRAEFAMTSRKLEMNVERLEARAAEQLIDISRKRDEIARLSRDQSGRVGSIKELEERVTRLSSEIADAEKR